MNEYYEFLVKKSTSPLTRMLRPICFVLDGITLFLALFLHWIFLIPFAVFVGATILVSRYANIEYEYLLAAGEISVDKIMNQQKRKHLFDLTLESVGQVIPANSPAREGLKAKNYKTIDVSSTASQVKVYSLVCNNQTEYLFNLNEKFLDALEEILPVGSVKR